MRLMFAVQKQGIKRVDDEMPVMNSVDYVDAEFIFSGKWDGLKKTVILQNNILGTTYQELDINDRCKIPIAYLNFPSFTVSVYGEQIMGDVVELRITTGLVVVKVADTGFMTPPIMTLTAEPTTGTIDTEFTFTAGIMHAKEPYMFVWAFDDIVDDTQSTAVAKRIFTTEGTHTVEVSSVVEGVALYRKIEVVVEANQP